MSVRNVTTRRDALRAVRWANRQRTKHERKGGRCNGRK